MNISKKVAEAIGETIDGIIYWAIRSTTDLATYVITNRSTYWEVHKVTNKNIWNGTTDAISDSTDVYFK